MASSSPSVIIIGAGIAGLSTGIYAQLNGYQSRIYEMHNLPGGLMTGWKRKGYTIDGCIHWLVGSNPSSSFYEAWQEIGLAQNMKIFNPEIFARVENEDGRVLLFYADPDRLEKHLLELSPVDETAIKRLCADIRLFSTFEPPSMVGGLRGFFKMLSRLPKLGLGMLRVNALSKQSATEWARQFQDPFLRKAFAELWFEEMTAHVMPVTLGFIAGKNAGYPLGGSLPMARAVEQRYCSLGGEIHYETRVEKILVEPLPDGTGSRAVGVRLADGSEVRADTVISAADGHATLFNMLDGRFISPDQRRMFDKGVIFPPILYVGLGINREFPELFGLTNGVSIFLDKPMKLAGQETNRLEYMIYNFDPSLAPAGKSVLTIMVPTSYEYWKELHADEERYEAEKQQVALTLIDQLDRRFPGLSGQVEMVDVATPVTFERYTGNWQGSFEGWMPTVELGLKPLEKTLPGLTNFYMVGQWVQTGGGIPSGPMTAKEVLGLMCKQDQRKFTTRG
jgi:phytoene dehydrogenase-like protein